MAGEPLLDLEGVAVRRIGADHRFELEIERLAIRPGDRLALVGPSGCGKSTCIDLLALALAPQRGRRFLFRAPDGSGITDVLAAWQARPDSLAPLRARHFGYVLQTGGLLPFLSVAENIGFQQRLLGRSDPARIVRLARALGIEGRLHAPPRQLSVGQRQRVAIARALAHRPAIVLADEPTASLDEGSAQAVMKLLVGGVAEEGCALVMVTHDKELAGAHDMPFVQALRSGDERTSRTVFARPLREAA